MSVFQWLQQQLLLPLRLRAPFLDVRPRGSSPALLGATRFFGSGLADEDGLRARLNELPPSTDRETAVVVAEKDEIARDARNVLLAQGYNTVYGCTFEAIQKHAPSLVLKNDIEPLSRALWRPSPALVSALPEIEAVLEKTFPCQQRNALDIGAGSGRDAAYLASKRWNVTAVDRDASLIAKAVALGNRSDQHILDTPAGSTARNRGRVQGVVRTFGKSFFEDMNWLQSNAAQLVVVVRFLRRGVLEQIGKGVLPGGFILYEHFLTGCEALGGPVKQSQVLQRGELEKIFGDCNGFKVFSSLETNLDDGRPVIRYLAQRQ